MKKIMFGGIVCIMLMTIVSANAAVQEYTETYTYTAGESESKLSARAHAQNEAVRSLLERIGIGILSNTKIKDFQITADVITMLQAGIVSSKEVEKDSTWDGKKYKTTLNIKVDPDDVEKSLYLYLKSTKDIEALQVKYDELLKEYEKLKIAKPDTATKRSEEIERELNKIALLRDGILSFQSKKVRLALANLNEVIERYPEYADAYVYRGLYYDSLGNYESYRKAVDDFKKALKVETETGGITYIRDALGLALYHVGSRWNEGHDVPQNYENAVKWFSEADQYGNKQAQYELGILYLEGRGVQADKIKAYFWLNKAATRGHSGADVYRTMVAMSLSMEEITEAQRLSSEKISENE